MKERKLWKKKLTGAFIDLAELGCSATEVPHPLSPEAENIQFT